MPAGYAKPASNPVVKKVVAPVATVPAWMSRYAPAAAAPAPIVKPVVKVAAGPVIPARKITNVSSALQETLGYLSSLPSLPNTAQYGPPAPVNNNPWLTQTPSSSTWQPQTLPAPIWKAPIGINMQQQLIPSLQPMIQQTFPTLQPRTLQSLQPRTLPSRYDQPTPAWAMPQVMGIGKIDMPADYLNAQQLAELERQRKLAIAGLPTTAKMTPDQADELKRSKRILPPAYPAINVTPPLGSGTTTTSMGSNYGSNWGYGGGGGGGYGGYGSGYSNTGYDNTPNWYMNLMNWNFRG